MTEITSRLSTALADRYKLEREIGAGGMATVYLAHDLKHDRKVALKVLKPELSAVLGGERFLNEIKVTANLQHPNILPLYDSGEADSYLYYVMPYIEGETLRDKLNREKQLSIGDTVEITKVIASALDFAHKRDVVHRDIKPENILLQDGVALVADFGIAVALSTVGGDRLTETGLSIGTPAYMSPEQVAGQRDLDARSDVYSLACVTYEMLAGDPPFVASNAQAVMAKHVTDPAPPITTIRPNVTPSIVRALTRALNKMPADRHDSAGGFAVGLTDPTAARDETISIVVLPFANMSPDPDNEYFSDGLTDEIITDLSGVQALRVISSRSAMMLKQTTKSLREIGTELSCDYALEGMVRRAGNHLRITAKLVETSSDTQLWADKYGGTTDDVFQMQESVSRAIVESLKVRLTPTEHAAIGARPIEDVRARECYMRAKNTLWNFTQEGLEEGIRQLKKGLDLVGNNVTLNRGLCEAYFQYVNTGLAIGREEEFLALIDECAEKMFAIDPESPDGYYVRACAQLPRGQTQEAARGLRRVLAARPNDIEALFLYAHILTWFLGRADLAKPMVERLLDLDPLTTLSRFPSVAGPLYSGDFVAAVEAGRQMFELDPNMPVVRAMLVSALYHAGQLDEAKEVCKDVVAQPDSDVGNWIMGVYRAMWNGDADEVARMCAGPYGQVAKWDQELPLYIAQAYAVVGKVTESLDWLETAIDMGVINYPYMSKYDPALENVRGEKRFAGLMERVKREWESFEV